MFSGQTLKGRSFKGQNLAGADFTGAHIQGANFTGAVLTGANFQGAKAGVRRWAALCVLIGMCLCSSTLGLFGTTVSDTVNTNYFHFFGPRDGIVTFSTVGLFSLLLLRRDLLVAIWGTMLCGFITWVGLFSWEYWHTHDFLDALIGQDSLTSNIITLVISYWAGISVVTSLSAMLLATAHVQANERRAFGYLELIVAVCALAAALPGAIGHTGNLARVNAILDTGLVFWLSWHISRAILKGAPRYAWLRAGALVLAQLGSTSFRQANLTQANFAGTRLNATDFTGAALMQTCFQQAQSLDYARVGNTFLKQSAVRQLVTTANGNGQSYSGCRLRGAHLAQASLIGADFTGADLSQANLRQAQLQDAIFVRTQAVGCCFEGAQLTGSCIESWNIDTSTQINDVVCDYVYMLSGQRERRPSEGNFEPGDFTKLFQDVLHTVDLIFRRGLDMSAFMAAFQAVQAQGETIGVRSIENKGGGMVVVKVEVPEKANKPQIQTALTQQYDQALQRIEARYQAELAAKDEQITLYREHRSELSKLTQLLTQQPIDRRAKSADKPGKIFGKRVVLKIGDASLNGLPVTLQLGDEGAPPHVETHGYLPVEDKLLTAQGNWQVAYQQMCRQSMRLAAPDVQVTNVSYQEVLARCQQGDRTLTRQINDWFNSPSFQPIRETLLSALSSEDSIRFILQTDHKTLRSLPLHRWTWFDRYPKAELVLSNATYQQTAAVARQSATEKVRILTILGDSTGLNVQRDRTLLEALPDVDLTCLIEPERSQLNDRLWEQPWDILFFAGHTISTNGQSQLRINPEENIALSELKYGLRTSVAQGLKLAILNTCDGLQLIQDLGNDVCMPPTIVMRHPVPDRIAQAFLNHFLTAFARGLPLHEAVREGRERLQGLESQFPFATWLPVLCQNPASRPLNWESLKPDEHRL